MAAPKSWDEYRVCTKGVSGRGKDRLCMCCAGPSGVSGISIHWCLKLCYPGQKQLPGPAAHQLLPKSLFLHGVILRARMSASVSTAISRSTLGVQRSFMYHIVRSGSQEVQVLHYETAAVQLNMSTVSTCSCDISHTSWVRGIPEGFPIKS